MNAYVDASVVLRVVFRQPGALREWTQIESAIASPLTHVECLRSLDRWALRGLVRADDLAPYRGEILDLLSEFSWVGLDDAILLRAGDPMPTPLGTLDAIHVATALALRAAGDERVVATHDAGLGTAARAFGFRVIGC